MQEFEILEDKFMRHRKNIGQYLQIVDKGLDPQKAFNILPYPAPAVWRRFNINLKIIDFTPQYLDWALHLIKVDYIKNDLICVNCGLENDSKSLKMYLKMIKLMLSQKYSVLAFDEQTNEPVGLQIFTYLNKYELQSNIWNARICEPALEKLIGIHVYMNSQVDLFLDFNEDSMLILGPTVIEPEYRTKGIGKQFLEVATDIAKAFYIPLVSGIFYCYGQQLRAEKEGFQVMYERPICGWVDDEDNPIIFDNPSKLYSFQLMALRAFDSKPRKKSKKP